MLHRLSILTVLLLLLAPLHAIAQDVANAPSAEDVRLAEELKQVLALQNARVKVVDQVYPSVVAIFGMNAGAGGGSGVLLDEAGYAVTNFHVVRPAGVRGKAGLADGKLYDWDLVVIVPVGDLAIIKLKGKSKFPVSAMGESDDVEVGEFTMAMGNPFLLAEDYTPTVTMGIVSGVKRFQKGMQGNLLVYGNCIQIDTSINPGNSGGPLYNMQAQVIGINGRGSFEERGRVNVGVGYAISMEQVRNFYMGLMATQTTRHGTLEATFRDTGEKVICDQIDLDSPIAKAGMELGDRLISFNGEPIDTANEFTNMIWTLPEAWPVHLEWENFEGKRKRAWVRLTHLDYGQPRAQPQPRRPQPATQPAAGPRVAPPGEIASVKMNQQHVRMLVKRWQRLAFGKVSRNQKAIKRVETVVENGVDVGTREVIEALDGRYVIKVTKGYGGLKTGAVMGYDGKQAWLINPGAGRFVDVKTAVKDYLPAQQKLFMKLLLDHRLAGVKDYLIENGDLVAGRRAYRIKTTTEKSEPIYVWLSLLDTSKTFFQSRPLKMSTHIDGDADASIVYDDYQEVQGMYLPMTRHLVRGLGDAKQRSFNTTELSLVKDLDGINFAIPEETE